MRPVVDPLGTGRYAPRPLCQDMGVEPATFSSSEVLATGRALPVWEIERRRGPQSSSARGADSELAIEGRSRVHEPPASLVADTRCVCPRRRSRTSTLRRRTRHERAPIPISTLIPVPRLRFTGPLVHTPRRTNATFVPDARRAEMRGGLVGEPLRAHIARVRIGQRSLRLHGRSDNPCS